MPLDKVDKALIYETVGEVKNITRRLDQHSEDRRQFNDLILNKLDEIKERQDEKYHELFSDIRKVEMKFMEDSSKTNLKIASIVGAIGIFSGGAGSFIFNMLKVFK